MKIQKFTFNPFQENSYVISDENGACAIIDPGCCDPSEQHELLEYITSNQLNVTHLINTHCHLDHIYGNRFVATQWKLPLHLHPLELPVLEMAGRSAEIYGLPVPEDGPDEKIFIEEGQLLKVGQLELEVLFVPGHAPGHVAFYHAASKNVIAGDVLFQGSIGRTDLPLGDHETLINSIKTKMYTLPNDTVVWCGHGPETTIGGEKSNNAFVRAE